MTDIDGGGAGTAKGANKLDAQSLEAYLVLPKGPFRARTATGPKSLVHCVKDWPPVLKDFGSLDLLKKLVSRYLLDLNLLIALLE